jgi:nucleotide-binding universal stress UspA family protein
MQGPIIAGTDGSETSRLAIAEAGSLASGTGRAVVIVFVRQPWCGGAGILAACGVGLFGGCGVGPATTPGNADEAIAQAQSIAILDPLGVTWEFEVRDGDPATEIMRAGMHHGADTIVVAGRRHGAVGGLARGAVIPQLLHRWPHSLFVVHPPRKYAATSTSGATR